MYTSVCCSSCRSLRIFERGGFPVVVNISLLFAPLKGLGMRVVRVASGEGLSGGGSRGNSVKGGKEARKEFHGKVAS